MEKEKKGDRVELFHNKRKVINGHDINRAPNDEKFNPIYPKNLN